MTPRLGKESMNSNISLTELSLWQSLIPCFWDTEKFSKLWFVSSGSSFRGKRCLVIDVWPEQLSQVCEPLRTNCRPDVCVHTLLLQGDSYTELVRPWLNPRHRLAGPTKPGTTNSSKITMVYYKWAGKSCKNCPDTFLLLTIAEMR